MVCGNRRSAPGAGGHPVLVLERRARGGVPGLQHRVRVAVSWAGAPADGWSAVFETAGHVAERVLDGNHAAGRTLYGAGGGVSAFPAVSVSGGGGWGERGYRRGNGRCNAIVTERVCGGDALQLGAGVGRGGADVSGNRVISSQ